MSLADFDLGVCPSWSYKGKRRVRNGYLVRYHVYELLDPDEPMTNHVLSKIQQHMQSLCDEWLYEGLSLKNTKIVNFTTKQRYDRHCSPYLVVQAVCLD